MSLTQLKLNFTDVAAFEKDFKDYKGKAVECMDFFDGVYAFGCPGLRSR